MAISAVDKPINKAARPILIPGTNFHRLRKGVHLGCVAAFILLPLFNVVRFDIPRQRFYFFGAELWISEFAIVFFSLMFLMFVVAAMAMLYGRIYCGYLCPQMIFSEAAVSLQDRLKRWTNKHLAEFSTATRHRIAATIFYAILVVASVFVSFIFISYFVEPRDLLRRLLAFDIRTAGGMAGATTTLLTLLDFALLRQRFCTTVCPYGYLQGILADRNTLLVQYRDPASACIHCDKCVRVCPMGIDIRNSAHQIECTHCAECVDACSTIMGRLGKGTLIHYAWGETGKTSTEERGWHRRIGLRDGKRVVVLLVLCFYAAGLYAAIAMRHPVLLRVAPDRGTLYRLGDDGLVYNKFRLRITNRTHARAQVSLQIDGLSGARFTQIDSPLSINSGEELQRDFEIAASPKTLAPGVNHFRVVGRTVPGGGEQEFPMTFITPEPSGPNQ